MTPLQRARKATGLRVLDLALAAGVSVPSVKKHLAGSVQAGVRTALAYAARLQRANREAGHPVPSAELTPNALFPPRERRCHRNATGTAKPAAQSQVTDARQASGGIPARPK